MEERQAETTQTLSTGEGTALRNRDLGLGTSNERASWALTGGWLPRIAEDCAQGLGWGRTGKWADSRKVQKEQGPRLSCGCGFSRCGAVTEPTCLSAGWSTRHGFAHSPADQRGDLNEGGAACTSHGLGVTQLGVNFSIFYIRFKALGASNLNPYKKLI